MKKLFNISSLFLLIGLSSCEKKDYPAGLPEYEHHYYVVYVPNNNNTKIVAQRTQTDLVKFPVQFYSTFSRPYDAVAHYQVVTTGLASPAQAGVDFEIVDKSGAPVQAENNIYSMVFPKAEQAKDTIYMKLLNNPAPGTRSAEIHLIENKNNEFYVDIFSTAFRRTLEIR